MQLPSAASLFCFFINKSNGKQVQATENEEKHKVEHGFWRVSIWIPDFPATALHLANSSSHLIEGLEYKQLLLFHVF